MRSPGCWKTCPETSPSPLNWSSLWRPLVSEKNTHTLTQSSQHWQSFCNYRFHDSEMLEPRSKGAKPGDNKIGTGRGTLRLRSKGPATVEEEVRPLVSHYTKFENKGLRKSSYIFAQIEVQENECGKTQRLFSVADRIWGEGSEEGRRPPGELHGHQRHRAWWVMRTKTLRISWE